MTQIINKNKLRIKRAKEFNSDELDTISYLLNIVCSLHETPVLCSLTLEEAIKQNASILGQGQYSKAWHKDDLVIKLSVTSKSFVIPKAEDDEFKYFAPTISYDIREYNTDYTFLIFQKMCDVRNRKQDVLYFFQRFPNTVYDIHDENVGQYKGKPIIFDC